MSSVPQWRRLQIVSVSIAGGIAVVCFIVSLLTGGDISNVFKTIALSAAGLCAVIGVTFAFTGDSR